MTRINVIPVASLHTAHAHAEWRELPRIFSAVRKAHQAGKRPEHFNIPNAYCLGTGHVTFFYNKLKYLANRHKDLTVRLLAHRYNLTYTTPLEIEYADIPDIWWGDYTPTLDDLVINQQRIVDVMENRDMPITFKSLDPSLIDTIRTDVLALEAALDDPNNPNAQYVDRTATYLQDHLDIRADTASWMAKAALMYGQTQSDDPDRSLPPDNKPSCVATQFLMEYSGIELGSLE